LQNFYTTGLGAASLLQATTGYGLAWGAGSGES
jgi:hypothetical protein